MFQILFKNTIFSGWTILDGKFNTIDDAKKVIEGKVNQGVPLNWYKIVNKATHLKGVEKLQRKELKKAIKEYSHRTNFYKLGLIRQLLQKQDKKHKTLVNAIPKVKCPHCGSYKITIDDDGSEYSSDEFLTCQNCWESFDDEYGYIEAMGALMCEHWGDRIAIELHFENPNIKSQEWQKFCESEILIMLGLKDEPENIF